MKIKFTNKKTTYIILSAVCVAFSVFLNIIFVPALIVSIESQNLQEILFCSFMIFLFLSFCAFGIYIGLQAKNRLTLNDDCIEGYYNGKFKIYYKDIECVSTHFEYTLPNSNEICLILHNGKSYHISSIKNIEEVYKKVLISSPNLASDLDIIKQRKEKTAKLSKIYLTSVISLVIIMFIAIFICIGLTGARDIPDFTEKDKLIFTCFIIFEFITVITLFLIAIFGAKHVRNKWALENMLMYLKAKNNRKKNLDIYKDKEITVKYKYDYSVRIIIYKKDEENEVFVIERYLGNTWRACSEELEYNEESFAQILSKIF